MWPKTPKSPLEQRKILWCMEKGTAFNPPPPSLEPLLECSTKYNTQSKKRFFKNTTNTAARGTAPQLWKQQKLQNYSMYQHPKKQTKQEYKNTIIQSTQHNNACDDLMLILIRLNILSRNTILSNSFSAGWHKQSLFDHE